MNHSFDIATAEKYGVEEAIFIENMRFWLAKNKANDRHFYDGRYWTYNSAKAFAKLFPYWSASQVNRIIKKLETAGLLLSGNYNQSAYDRTKWYSLNEEVHLTNSQNGNDESVKTLIRTDVNPDVLVEPTSSSSTTLPDCPHERLIDLYAEHLPDLPQPRKSLWRSGKNAPNMKARWRWVMTECYESGDRKGTRMATDADEGLEWFNRFFAYVAKSDWLTGKNGKWSSDLGWLMNAANFEKVLQGNYINERSQE